MPKRKSSNQSKGPRLLPRAVRRNSLREDRKIMPRKYRKASMTSEARCANTKYISVDLKVGNRYSYIGRR